MSGGEAIAGATGLVVALGSAFAGLRALRKDKATEAENHDARLMAGYEGLMDALREDMRRLREEREAERKEWNAERIRLSEEIARLRVRVQELEKRTPPHGTRATS